MPDEEGSAPLGWRQRKHGRRIKWGSESPTSNRFFIETELSHKGDSFVSSLAELAEKQSIDKY
jgi:hypothetical protein